MRRTASECALRGLIEGVPPEEIRYLSLEKKNNKKIKAILPILSILRELTQHIDGNKTHDLKY